MKLSICCLTYNHAAYIEQAIRSFINQKTSFEFEIVIGDDASTDGTSEILQEYSNKHLNIKHYRHDRNRGMMANAIFTLEQCTGEFIALCEGDDYWTDPEKLQKQVDFLESTNDYVICFTGSIIKNEIKKTEKVFIPPAIITIDELLKNNQYCTATAVFASRYFKPVPQWFAHMPFGDWPLYLTVLYASRTNAYCLQEATAVYRMHETGLHGSMKVSNAKLIKTLEWDIDCYRKLQTFLFGPEYSSFIRDCIEAKETVINDLLDERKNQQAVVSEITAHIPENGSFILIDDWNLEIVEETKGRRVIPFTEKNGTYWGPPADDAAAIAEIKRQQEKGVDGIVFTWQAFWWLQHYAGMYQYLTSTYQCLLRNERLLIFDLQKNLARRQQALTHDALHMPSTG